MKRFQYYTSIHTVQIGVFYSFYVHFCYSGITYLRKCRSPGKTSKVVYGPVVLNSVVRYILVECFHESTCYWTWLTWVRGAINMKEEGAIRGDDIIAFEKRDYSICRVLLASASKVESWKSSKRFRRRGRIRRRERVRSRSVWLGFARSLTHPWRGQSHPRTRLKMGGVPFAMQIVTYRITHL